LSVRSIRKILVPTDFSETSGAAYETAIELSERLGADLCLVHVHQVPAYVFPDGLLPLSPDLLEEMERAVVAELERQAQRARAAGLRVSVRSRTGVVHQEILDQAKAWAAELIVMGTHGRSGFSHALLGSVAERVLRKAPCPVLTVGPRCSVVEPQGPSTPR
jgi:nucleotide-binding universal stress UspA family protein